MDTLLGEYLIAAAMEPDAHKGTGGDEDDWRVGLPVIVSAILALVVLLLVIRYCKRSDCLRYASFVALHLMDYGTNVAVMYIFWRSGRKKYLLLLVPAHLTVGFFCMYTAATVVDFGNMHPIPKFVLLVGVLGIMQGIQVKLAHDDFMMQQRPDVELVDVGPPPMMPARFHCKAMDGMLEGTVFGFVCMYALLKAGWLEDSGTKMEDKELLVMYGSAFFSFLTTGLALMEVDYRTSAAVQRVMDSSLLCQVRHCAFRVSEVTTRLMTVLVFCTFMRPLKNSWWIAFMCVGIDYLLGVLLLLLFGGEDPVRHSALLLGVPFFLANVMQFVDAPGLNQQARRISNIVVPARTLELIAVFIFCATSGTHINVEVLKADGHKDVMDMATFIFTWHPVWALLWISSAGIYFVLLLAYALIMRPEADVHSAVAYGEIRQLRALLDSGAVLDVNRYGPDGRTPLHIAAINGHLDCIKKLVEERANIRARTNDGAKTTALHLAVQHHKTTDVLKLLCESAHEDGPLLNASNALGDTALHIASRRHNITAVRLLLRLPLVNPDIANAVGKTAAQCSISEQFGYDHNSDFETDIADLFQRRQAGELGSSPTSGTSVELASMPGLGASSSNGSLQESHHPSHGRSESGESPEAPADGDAPAEHVVPLVDVKPGAEEAFVQRTSLGRNAPAAQGVSKSGLSSFMLSQGLGALSKALLTSIQEEGASSTSVDVPEVTVKIDDFVEMRKLGEGTFGKVLLVSHKETGQRFALKIMDKQKYKAQKIVAKVHSEQYILKTTRHPFIVALHYAFQCSTFWALVMDFCPNGDLQDHLGKHGKPGLQIREAARLAGEVLLALEHLHCISVIFRDLKLENVVLDPNFHAKVTDFGLAKKLNASSDAKTMCGSYGYAAPEILVAKGGSPYTIAVDLYSYGVMLYMMLSGGEAAQHKPEQRLPPMKHSSLRRKLQAAQTSPPGEWARPDAKALELLIALTADNPKQRTTCAQVKQRPFFTLALGRPVDQLLDAMRA